jgi:hypothetical protein
MNKELVTKRMKDEKITVSMLCKELGIDDSTYYRKMQNNGDDFSALDLLTFKRLLRLNDKEALDFLLS